MIDAFHFLRPLWLLALLPVALVAWGLWRRRDGDNGWGRLIRPELLGYLLETAPDKTRWLPLLALLSAWVLAVTALAGPTWEQLPQPVYQGQQAQVLILDLSPSMLATDLTPSRLVHARHRLIDLITAREEGLTGLVVYSGDAHVVAPLSHDRRTLLALAPTLSPEIMPTRGSRVEAAVEQALQLLQAGRHGRGDLVLITDGIAPAALETVRARLAGLPYRLSILGVGSAAGAPVPLADGRFARDGEGKLHLARLNREELAALARDRGGLYRDLALDGSDVPALVAYLQRPLLGDVAVNETELARPFDRWDEAGPWLVLVLLPVAALAHRRGWMLLVLLVPLSLPRPAHALEWQDLWLTPDQQGERALARGEPEAAASLFEDPRRQGQALYQSEAYAKAADAFATAAGNQPASVNHYNYGNALARSGSLKEALEAYDRALALDPSLEDAHYNRALVEALMKQQSNPSGEGGEEGEEQSEEQGDPEGESQDPSGPSDDQGSEGESGESSGSPETNGEGADGERADGERADGEGSQAEPPSSASQGESDTESPPEETPGSPKVTEPGGETEEEGQAPDSKEPSPAPREEEAEAGAPVAPGNAGEKSDPVLERWLRQLPEDPGGLLRRKFAYEYQQRAREAAPEPGPDEQRW